MAITLTTEEAELVVKLLELAHRYIPDTCTCHPRMERDTGAWIHDEDECLAFLKPDADFMANLLISKMRRKE